MPARHTPFDDKRAKIAALASAPAAVAVAELRRFLADPNGYIVGEAAEVAAKLELADLVHDLGAALRRLLGEPASADKGCVGKKKILEALLALEGDERDAFLMGLHHTQSEPAFPRAVDTAAPVRGLCAHALVQFDHPTALLDVTPLLMDPEPIVRAEAAHALGRSGIDAAGAVLHLKALAGDREPDVMESCYKALLRLAPGRYLPVVAAALEDAEGQLADAAAVALGESRLKEALPLLKAALERSVDPRERQSVSMAIGLLRSDEANDLLLSLVEKAPEAQASAALAALALHRHDAKIAERARKAVAARGSKKLAAALREQFGG